jgi:hypothetical protein
VAAALREPRHARKGGVEAPERVAGADARAERELAVDAVRVGDEELESGLRRARRRASSI